MHSMEVKLDTIIKHSYKDETLMNNDCPEVVSSDLWQKWCYVGLQEHKSVLSLCGFSPIAGGLE